MGLSIDGSFNYKMKASGTATLICGPSPYNIGTGLHHQWSANYVDLYAWYQFRFGSKRRCCISKRWDLTSSSSCDADKWFKIWEKYSTKSREEDTCQ